MSGECAVQLDLLIFSKRIVSSFEFSSYVRPFTTRHMDLVISLLTPHVTRWRSLVILTDAWAPMYHALLQIGPALCSYGAPLLESLTLMRCNEFTSHTSTFQPAALRDPLFLSTWENLPILPKLASLTLKGVHVDWDSLADALIASSTPLRHLDLSCHSMSVRPSAETLSRILSHCAPYLEKLVMRNSGPNFDISDVSSLTPVLLPKLSELSLAYRAGRNGLLSLELMELPELQTLTLEDGTHLGDQHAAIDAGPLLVYIATGVRSRGHLQPFSITYSITEGLKYHPGPLLSTCAASSWYSVQSPFRKLEHVNLIRVQAFPMHLRWFYHSLDNLKSLRLEYMDLNSVYALMPPPFHDRKWNVSPLASISSSSSSPCPCPLLETFSIRIPGHLDYETFRVITFGMIKLRPTYGKGKKLKQFTVRAVDSVDARLMDTERTEEIEGMRVSIQKTVGRGDEDSDEDEDEGWDSEDDDDSSSENGAFELNGAFNDPQFDSVIGSVVHP